MADLKIGKSLGETDVLWRYLPLDKFIDLVDSRELHFAPLTSYETSDPFEGYLPHVAMDALASVSRMARDQHRNYIEALAKMMPAEMRPELLRTLGQADTHVPTMKAVYKNIAACMTVNCWYKSEHESEGMWGLYSKSGVAIRTSIGAVKGALAADAQDHVIHAGSVKYVDFANSSLVPKDCVTADGHLIGMIKRVAYEHENEVRLFISPAREPGNLEPQLPTPIRVSVDVDTLLEAVVVSPFATPLIERSVRAICRWAKIDERIVSKSGLLDNCEYLLDVYK